MKVKISYTDRESLSATEIEHNAKKLFGATAQIQLLPEANTTREFIRHAIVLAITDKQLDSFFDDEEAIYEGKIAKLKKDFMIEVESLLQETIDGNTKAWA